MRDEERKSCCRSTAPFAYLFHWITRTRVCLVFCHCSRPQDVGLLFANNDSSNNNNTTTTDGTMRFLLSFSFYFFTCWLPIVHAILTQEGATTVDNVLMAATKPTHPFMSKCIWNHHQSSSLFSRLSLWRKTDVMTACKPLFISESIITQQFTISHIYCLLFSFFFHNKTQSINVISPLSSSPPSFAFVYHYRT